MRRGGAGKRRDQNEPAIIEALRAVGATVEQLSGPNVPDLLVGYHGANWLFEVKTPKGKESDGQKSWSLGWMGTVYVVRSPDQALGLIGCQARKVV